MKKIIVCISLLLKVSFGICQEVKLNIKKHMVADDIKYIQVFECNRAGHDCYDQKGADIMINKTGRRLSPCFRLIKTLNEADSKKLIGILRSKETYTVNPYYAFTTDYAIVLYDKNGAVNGWVNFSFVCNNSYSMPDIGEKKIVSPKDETLAGFSTIGRARILKILGLWHHNFNRLPGDK